MGNITEADMSFIIDLIDAGQCDQHIDAIIDAAVAQRKFTREMTGASNRINLKPDDRVQTRDLQPKYLNGITGNVSPKLARKHGDIVIEVDPIYRRRIGRYSNDGVHLNVPAACLVAI